MNYIILGVGDIMQNGDEAYDPLCEEWRILRKSAGYPIVNIHSKVRRPVASVIAEGKWRLAEVE